MGLAEGLGDRVQQLLQRRVVHEQQLVLGLCQKRAALQHRGTGTSCGASGGGTQPDMGRWLGAEDRVAIRPLSDRRGGGLLWALSHPPPYPAPLPAHSDPKASHTCEPPIGCGSEGLVAGLNTASRWVWSWCETTKIQPRTQRGAMWSNNVTYAPGIDPGTLSLAPPTPTNPTNPSSEGSPVQ